MANALQNYIPTFFARESLIILKERLGFGSRVNRRYEDERRSFDRGEYVNIKRPATFVANSMGSTVTVQDLETTKINIQLANWYEVTHKVTDKELSFSEESLVREHIDPMAHAIAREIDRSISGLSTQVGPSFVWDSPATPANITQIWQIMLDENVPQGPWNLALEPVQAQALLANAAFSQQQGAGDLGVNTQRTGNLGMKFGFDTFVTNNINTTQAATNTMVDLAMTIDTTSAGYTAGTTTISIADVAGTIDLSAGHTISITHADSTVNSYRVTANKAIVSGGYADVTIEPGLRHHVNDGAAVTMLTAGDNNTNGIVNTSNVSMAFHRDALALVMAPLDDGGDGRGAEIFTARDEESGLFIRARRWYEGKEATQYVTMDALWGADALNGHMAVRLLADK